LDALSFFASAPVIMAVVLAVVLLIFLRILAGLYRRVGPNQGLIVYGMGSPKVVKGGGAIVWPMIQSADELSLELMSFDVAPEKELYTHQGVAVLIDAVTQLKVKSDLESVKTAAEQFLDKSAEAREGVIRLVMEGHLRGIVGQLTVEHIVKEPEMVGDKVRSTCAADLEKMGLEMVSFTIKEVRDQNEYIRNMGLPDIERVKKEANIAAAEAHRDTEIKRAHAFRDAAVAKALASEQRIIAEAASQTKEAEAQRDLETKRAEYAETIARQRAQTDKSYEIHCAIAHQKLVEEQTRIQEIERLGLARVQEAEIVRNEHELTATVLSAAQVEAKRMIALAEAEKVRLKLEAEGRAEAVRMQGEAEAAVIRQKGEAEAAAMEERARAFRSYNEAAVLDKLLSSLPELVGAVAEPLSRIDKITVVSTGSSDQGGTGVDKVTADVAKIVAQVPAIVESLSGVSLGDLLKRVPRIGTAMQPSAPLPPPAPPLRASKTNGARVDDAV
jgi:flotillin